MWDLVLYLVACLHFSYSITFRSFCCFVSLFSVLSLIKEKCTYTTLHLDLLRITNVTEDPTKNGPSSVFRRNGPGRRSWKEQDPGRRLGSIAFRRRIEAVKADWRCYEELYQRGRPQKPHGTWNSRRSRGANRSRMRRLTEDSGERC